MLIGYARVSSTEQETTLQRDALRRAGVKRIFEEKRSAVKHRPQLEAAISCLQEGDTLVFYKVDRLARSLSHLLNLVDRITSRRATLRSLTEPIDTSSAAGRMTVQLLGAFAEFERAMIRERSMAGQDAARSRGVAIGRPRSLTSQQAAVAYELYQNGESMSKVAAHFHVHLSCIKRVILRIDNPNSPAVRLREWHGHINLGART